LLNLHDLASQASLERPRTAGAGFCAAPIWRKYYFWASEAGKARNAGEASSVDGLPAQKP